MSPATPLGFDFALLGNLDDEEAGEGEDAPSVERLNVQNFWRAFVWTVCSAMYLCTTKQLLTTYGFHYPFTICCQVFLCILSVYTSVARPSSRDYHGPDATYSRWTVRRPERGFGGEWLAMMPASVAAAASLPLLLQGLLHMPSLPVLVMLFPLAYAAESVILFVSSPFCRTWRRLPLETLIALVASSLVLYNEYRLEVPGLISGVLGVLLLGISRGFFTIGSEKFTSDLATQSKLRAFHGFVMMALVLGTIVSFLLVITFELPHIGSYSWSTESVLLTVLNPIFFAGAAFTGSSLFVYSPLSFADTKPQFSSIPIRGIELYATSISSLLVLVDAFHSGLVSVSWAQIAAYMLGAICLGGFEQIHNLVLIGMDNTHTQINKSFRMDTAAARRPSRYFTGLALFLVVTIISWTLARFSSVASEHLFPGHPTKLDTMYIPAKHFEIVVSMYNEDPNGVRSMLDKFKATSFLKRINPRVTVYTKNPAHDLNELKNATGADTVERLDNYGREGGTYLWHMVNKWDTLASQTMFVQAHAHNMRELVPRIDSYLAPGIGFLSLGFAGITCKCGTCTDRWGWNDKADVIPTVYKEIYGQDCEKETPVQLTFKGQFVASGRRIRGINKKIYERLLDTITMGKVPSSIVAAKEGGVTGVDTPDNPYFGFAMERIWGLVMQCGTDQRIIAKCPSLLSGMSIGGKPGDCGCLDGGA